jgi:hypothetical protein
MTDPLSRALQSLFSIEAALMGCYTPQATTALGHARIAILALGEAQKQQTPGATPE